VRNSCRQSVLVFTSFSKWNEGGHSSIPRCPYGDVIAFTDSVKEFRVIRKQHACEAVKTELVKAGQNFLALREGRGDQEGPKRKDPGELHNVLLRCREANQDWEFCNGAG